MPRTTKSAGLTRKQAVSAQPKPSAFEHSIEFPVIRGIQAGREFYTAQVPIRLLRKLFTFDPSSLPPLERSQRLISHTRVKKISSYILDNPQTYVFGALVVMIDGDIEFTESTLHPDMGMLRTPMESVFHVVDGQHRLEGIKRAALDAPDLSEETIPVVIFLDSGIKRRSQVFLDLNQHPSKPSKSVVGAFDHRDTVAEAVRALIKNYEFYRLFTTIDAATISAKSEFLFTFAALREASALLCAQILDESMHSAAIAQFWSVLLDQQSTWRAVWSGDLSASELRADGDISTLSISTSAIALALGWAMQSKGETWAEAIDLSRVNWNRSNPDFEGMILMSGHVVKNRDAIKRLANYVYEQINVQ